MTVSKTTERATKAPQPLDKETRSLWKTLERKLLAIGGERVIWRGNEPHLADLLERGQAFQQPVKRRRGQPCACHENSAKLWAKDIDTTQLVVGYGLSDDGIWRQHTWGLRKGTILETTTVREQYWGTILGDFDALQFWWANHAVHEYTDFNEGVATLVERYPRLLSVIKAFVESQGYQVVGPREADLSKSVGAKQHEDRPQRARRRSSRTK